ncbi:MAG: hypothetical protein ACRD1K_13880 [Acidimicrobiales bacterium]
MYLSVQEGPAEATECLIEVLEGDVDRLYQVAFAYHDADEAAAWARTDPHGHAARSARAPATAHAVRPVRVDLEASCSRWPTGRRRPCAHGGRGGPRRVMPPTDRRCTVTSRLCGDEVPRP